MFSRPTLNSMYGILPIGIIPSGNWKRPLVSAGLFLSLKLP